MKRILSFLQYLGLAGPALKEMLVIDALTASLYLIACLQSHLQAS